MFLSFLSLRFFLQQCEDASEFVLNWHKDIRVRSNPSTCLDVSEGGDRAPIKTYPCHGGKGNQLWKYDWVGSIHMYCTVYVVVQMILMMPMTPVGHSVACPRSEPPVPRHGLRHDDGLRHSLSARQ